MRNYYDWDSAAVLLFVAIMLAALFLGTIIYFFVGLAGAKPDGLWIVAVGFFRLFLGLLALVVIWIGFASLLKKGPLEP